MADSKKKATIKPIIIHDTENNIDYTLEFNRESIKFAEARGFVIGDVDRFPMTKMPELFFYAFRMHHKNVSREKTDRILFDDLGGLSEEVATRLGELYGVPYEALDNSGTVKNARMTVEL